MPASQDINNELFKCISELNETEQAYIVVFSALYIKLYNNLIHKKCSEFDDYLTAQINFYGKSKEMYSSKIELFLNKYTKLMNDIIAAYNVLYRYLITTLQDVQAKQKLEFVNEKINIFSGDINARNVSVLNIKKYDEIIDLCYDHLHKCKDDLENEINKFFYYSANGLMKNKQNIFQKFTNFFTGKKKIDIFIITSVTVQLNQLEKNVAKEVELINNTTIDLLIKLERVHFNE